MPRTELFRHVYVRDIAIAQGFRKCTFVVLRIEPACGERPHVHNAINSAFIQEINEVPDLMSRMSNRVYPLSQS